MDLKIPKKPMPTTTKVAWISGISLVVATIAGALITASFQKSAGVSTTTVASSTINAITSQANGAGSVSVGGDNYGPITTNVNQVATFRIERSELKEDVSRYYENVDLIASNETSLPTNLCIYAVADVPIASINFTYYFSGSSMYSGDRLAGITCKTTPTAREQVEIIYNRKPVQQTFLMATTTIPKTQ